MRRLLSFLPTHFTLCLILGIVLQYHFQVLELNTMSAMLIFLIILMLLWHLKQYKKRQAFTLLSWLFFVFIGMCLLCLQDESTKKDNYTRYNSSDLVITFRVDKILKENLYDYKYIGEIVRVGTTETRGNVLLSIAKKNVRVNRIRLNDFLHFKSAIVPVEAPKNPFQFDYKAYLEKQGVHHQVVLRDTAYIHKAASQKTIYGRAAHIRYVVEEKLHLNGFAGDELAVIKALVLGERSAVSKSLLQAYTQAGAIHILAVSGLHVGVILWILSTVLQPLERLWKGKFLKLILILLLLWSFAFIAGLSASVVRAVTMFSAVAVAMTAKRKALVIHSLITSMFVLLLVNPLFLFDVGFQLSYLAVFSIVILQPKFALLWKPKLRIVAFFWQLFTVSMAAQIGVLPMSLFYFHQFPGLFILSNLVIVPCIAAILIGGIACVVLSLCNLLPTWMASLYASVIRLMNDFVGWIAMHESFLITEISFSGLLLITSYLSLFLAMYLLEKGSYKRWVYFLRSVLLLQLCLLYEQNVLVNSNEVIVFNKSRHTLVGENRGGYLHVFHTLDTLAVKKLQLVKYYKIGMRVIAVKFQKGIPNLIPLQKGTLLIVDSLGVYGVDGLESPTVLLRSSPKVNLERLIERMRPKRVIADASNYKSLVLRWKDIALKNNIPFVYTEETGALVIE